MAPYSAGIVKNLVTHCNLPSVCAICGDLHAIANCKKIKEDAVAKNCSNCGGWHTANYIEIAQSMLKLGKNVRAETNTTTVRKSAIGGSRNIVGQGSLWS